MPAHQMMIINTACLLFVADNEKRIIKEITHFHYITNMQPSPSHKINCMFQSREEHFYRNHAFLIYSIMATPKHRNSTPRGMKLQLCQLLPCSVLHVLHVYTLSACIWPHRNNAFTEYDQHGHALANKNPCPGDHEIYNFGKTFLGHHNYTLNFLIYAYAVAQ